MVAKFKAQVVWQTDEGGDIGGCSTVDNFVGESVKFKWYSKVNKKPGQ